jgi:hypothetical protein
VGIAAYLNAGQRAGIGDALQPFIQRLHRRRNQQ